MFLEAPKQLALRDLENYGDTRNMILEIGFGHGQMLEHAASLGFRIMGTEISAAMVTQARDRYEHNFQISVGMAQDIDLTRLNGDYKIVFCFEVIEHLENPLELLKSLPGNVLYLSTPNPYRWWKRLGGPWEPWDCPPNHLRRYNPEDLAYLLAEAGYKGATIVGTRVKPEDLLRIPSSLGWGKNGEMSENFDEVRTSVGGWKNYVRAASFPVTWSLAKFMTMKGYQGPSWYVKATR